MYVRRRRRRTRRETKIDENNNNNTYNEGVLLPETVVQRLTLLFFRFNTKCADSCKPFRIKLSTII